MIKKWRKYIYIYIYKISSSYDTYDTIFLWSNYINLNQNQKSLRFLVIGRHQNRCDDAFFIGFVYFILFYFILFYFILFYFILFYFFFIFFFFIILFFFANQYMIGYMPYAVIGTRPNFPYTKYGG